MKLSRFPICRILALAALAALLVPFTTQAQTESTLPPEAFNAKLAHEAERKETLLKLDHDYLKQLAKIQEKYTRENKVNTALAIKREIDQIEREIEELSATPDSPESDEDGDDPGITVPQGKPVTVVIKASDSDGVALENLRKGDQLILQYVAGQWKSHGELASENPDSPVLFHGDENRLAIFSKKSPTSRFRPLALVPPETQQKPFIYILPSDYHRISLRIHLDPDGHWSENPGSVTYRVQLKREP
ncbi:MAG: hypothetical protein KDN19_22755 [Verrucomicrobiae bacterium]|nr:hypothetical protein [Verrucomicrobiae bacterium]